MSVQIDSVAGRSAVQQTGFVVSEGEEGVDLVSTDTVRGLDTKYQSSPRASGLWTSNGDANGVLLAFVDPPDKPVKEPKEPRERITASGSARVPGENPGNNGGRANWEAVRFTVEGRLGGGPIPAEVGGSVTFEKRDNGK